VTDALKKKGLRRLVLQGCADGVLVTDALKKKGLRRCASAKISSITTLVTDALKKKGLRPDTPDLDATFAW